MLLLALGAIVSGYLGYRLYDMWVPAAFACAVVAIQFVAFQLLQGGTRIELYAFSLIMNLLVFYATFGIGRAIAQRRRGMR
jgi:hypothetical protein